MVVYVQCTVDTDDASRSKIQCCARIEPRALLSIAVPDDCTVDARALEMHWKASARKIHRRFEFGLQMASKLSLPCFVDEQLASENRQLLSAAKRTHFVDDILNKVQQKRSRDETISIFKHQSMRWNRARFNGLTFALGDNPTRRYRRRRGTLKKRSDSSVAHIIKAALA